MSDYMPPKRALRLLLIDDDEVDRSAVRRALGEDSGEYEIEEFDSGERGLARILESGGPEAGVADCVLLDYSLPGANGFEVLDRLREAGIELPIIMLTGIGDEELVIESLRRGAYDYLPKSKLEGETLGSKIRTARRLLEARQRTRKAEEELQESVVQLRRAVTARDSVLAVVSHDLRGPLNNIELAMGIFEAGGSEQQRELAISSVRRAVARADRLINDLLDVARLSGGALEIIKREVDPGGIVKLALADAQPVLEQKRVKLEVEIEAELPPIYADRHRIHQVLDNLLRNAIQYGPKGGEVRVEARRVGGSVEFSVCDQGPGLDEEEQVHVFDRFWRAEGRKASAGSGLGLAIAKGLVDSHGGMIGVECPGQGSRFFFTIPLASELSQAASEEPGSDTE